jgi:CheY-like chemotaxis protein
MSPPQKATAPVVLVVDDEPMILRMMERALVSAGYEVHAAPNGLRALELARILPAPPAVMVSDVQMEPIDGPDLARLMHEASPATLVMFVSGYAADSERRLLSGPLLKKPFSPDQLVRAVAELTGSTERTLGAAG